jgi:hypothetical protein
VPSGQEASIGDRAQAEEAFRVQVLDEAREKGFHALLGDAVEELAPRGLIGHVVELEDAEPLRVIGQEGGVAGQVALAGGRAGTPR